MTWAWNRATPAYWPSVEFRHDLGHLVSGQSQAVAFVDGGERVNVDRHAFVAGENGATLSGAGLGLNWTGPNQWHARLYVAVPVGPTPDLIASNKVRPCMGGNRQRILTGVLAHSAVLYCG